MATPRHPLAGEPVGEPCPGQRALTAAVAAAPSPFLSLSLPFFLSSFLYLFLEPSGVENCLELVIPLETHSSRDCLIGGKVVLGEKERGKKILSIRLDLDFDLRGLYGG